MFREKCGMKDINTSHSISSPDKRRKAERLMNSDSSMVLTSKIELRYDRIGEVG